MRHQLRLTHSQHELLQLHLLPGDGLEAVAVGICGRRVGKDVHALSLRSLVPIPFEECKVRTPDRVTWSTRRLVPLLNDAAKHDLAILKIHSHPGGYDRFSDTDDFSDADLFQSVSVWTESLHPHCSVIMLPSGRLFGRVIMPDGSFHTLDSVLIPGDDIKYWPAALADDLPRFVERHAQLFGRGTTQLLRRLSVAVVGCSGTGSPVIEQLVRLGVGRIVLVDPDEVEERNLNRIINARHSDATNRRPKVEMFADAIASMGFGTEVVPIQANVVSRQAVDRVAECDVIFGCMDGVEGRHLLNRLASYYLIPYFDLGVKLQADSDGGIDEACGAIHYIRPDGASLLDRRVYTLPQLKADGLRRTDPNAYRDQMRAGYIHGVQEDRPAVISINMQIASYAVNELLARLHPFRLDSNAESAVVRVSFMQGMTYREADTAASGMFDKVLGRGDSEPRLGMPELGHIETNP